MKSHEHRLFAFITMNWRGKPLVSYLAIIQLITSTTTDTGLTVACQLDANAWVRFVSWCQERQVAPIAADPEIVAEFLEAEANLGYSFVTIGHRLSLRT
jgi:hypothetical protein